MQIRFAEKKDAAAILKHCRQAFGESDFLLTEPEEFTMTIQEEEIWIEKSLQSGDLILIAEIDQEVVGMLNFRRSKSKKVNHLGYFGISIQKRHCNQGLGSKMMKLFLQWAEGEPGLEKICLEVFAFNERAIRLYKRFGFEEEGRKIKHIKRKDGTYADELLMYRFVK
ncbi:MULTISPECIES: GNAT family N-acetyltransferase [unclassified Cytobacillus]|uniref:GNAT family N-acetyltransferase n=1 Tax=unclassified Cytobacillus TaxID=2675268 RepID=UPI001358715A|nr:GNAT family N-acetyltransferase [Cytobacillus sp. AMY 15.2]KAF0818069.1 Acetyltransferase, GNAT family [Bacillus sp. ZZV12-4809]MCM3092352.1 GNAT family N-acetyltransferase [Cytobacillus sp. AMY 15.2]